MPTLDDFKERQKTQKVIDETDPGSFYPGGAASFDSAVSANASVAANTAARHTAATISAGDVIAMGLVGQQISVTLNAAAVLSPLIVTAGYLSLNAAAVISPLEYTGGLLTLNQATVDEESLELLATLTTAVSSQFDTASDSLANVTALTYALEAGKTYHFHAVLFFNADVVGGHKYAIGGTCTAASITYQINSLSNSVNAFVITARQTALGGSAGQAGSTAGITYIDGTIVVDQAGTLTVQFAQNAANGTSSILTGSIFQIIPA